MFLISNYSSATWPPDVRRLALTYMQDPFQVCVGSLDLKVSYKYNNNDGTGTHIFDKINMFIFIII